MSTERFTATVRCPTCGATYTCALSQIPELCDCGQRFWHPIERDEEGRPICNGCGQPEIYCECSEARP